MRDQAAQTPAPGRRVAITIDDGPVVGEMKDLANFQRISAGLIGSLQAEKVPATIFINERQLNVPGQRDARVAALEAWLDAGFDLGNHTYSHPSANSVPMWQFGDDVVKGEVIMRPLIEQRGRTLVWFRYPFLHSGTTADIHQGIMDFLEQRNYRVAPVTVDYADYTFAGVYRSQRLAGKADVAEKIKDAYLDQIGVGFEYAEKASVELFGYEVPQILLIHCNELNAIDPARQRRTASRARLRVHHARRGHEGSGVSADGLVRGTRRVVALAHRHAAGKASDRDQRARAGVDRRVVRAAAIAHDTSEPSRTPREDRFPTPKEPASYQLSGNRRDLSPADSLGVGSWFFGG